MTACLYYNTYLLLLGVFARSTYPPATNKMKFTVPAVLLAVAVSAQSTSDSSSGSTTTCAAANIVDACLDTTNGYLAQCTDNADYQCKCDKYTAIMT